MVNAVVEVTDQVSRLKRKFESYQYENRVKSNYYDSKQRLKDLGISIPPIMRNIDVVVGWPGIAVDVLEERLDFEGWNDDDLDFVYQQNDLDVYASMAHQDALIFGTSFITVTSGMDGEPDPLIGMVPPTEMVGTLSNRTNRLTEACHFYVDNEDDDTEKAVLYTPNSTLWLVRGRGGWAVEQRDDHNLGRVQVVQLINRARGSHGGGRSEITPAVRGYTDMALRTLVGSEIAREFYAVPQRYMMGAPENFFIDEDGNQRSAWDAMMGKILAVEADEDAQPPIVGQFAAHDMRPFFAQIESLAQMFSAETSVPQSYLGFNTTNPASADAIRMYENRLIKKAERRQAMFGKGWTEVGRLSLMVRDGRDYSSLTRDELAIRPEWRDASTPTRAAAADEVLKMASMGTYAPDGEYVLKRLGLSPQDKELVRRDRAASSALALDRMKKQQEIANAQLQGQARASDAARQLGSNDPDVRG